jgi:hypothetical protein
MMKIAFRGLLSFGIALGLSTVVSAKGPTTRIVVSSVLLSNPIEITDANIVKEFQVWTGPGTRSCIGGITNCVEGTEGFIVDWLSGTVDQPRSGLQRYEVSFYTIDARLPVQQSTEHLAYVVSFEYDPSTSQGYVYLPGKGDQWFGLNSATIHRGNEGNWFRASGAWQDVVVPLIAAR